MSSRVTRTERAAIFKTSERILRGKFFDIRVAPAASSAGRLFLVVPRAVGNAVERNLVKRRARAVFHEGGFVTCGYHLILFARPGATGVSFGELQNIFKTAYQILSERRSSSA